MDISIFVSIGLRTSQAMLDAAVLLNSIYPAIKQSNTLNDTTRPMIVKVLEDNVSALNYVGLHELIMMIVVANSWQDQCAINLS